MSVKRIASRYAKALIDLAVEQDKLERILEDVESFVEVTKNRDFSLLLKSPIVNSAKKNAIITEIFEGKYDELTMAFLKILVNKKREMYLADVARDFILQYKHMKHISTVRLTTAVPISDELLAAIHAKLLESAQTDAKVEIITKVNPELIGGFVLAFDDKIYDASIQQKLKDLRKEFADNLYVSKIVAQ